MQGTYKLGMNLVSRWRLPVVGTARNVEKMGKTAEMMARITQDSAHAVMDYALQAHRINTELVQQSTEIWLDELLHQRELSQKMTQALIERAQDQASTFQRFFGRRGNAFVAETTAEVTTESVDTLPSNATAKNLGLLPSNGSFTVGGYDRLGKKEIIKRLDDLTVEQLQQVRDHEARHKNRSSLMEELETRLKANS
jgi:hypothetical protein